MKPKQVVIHCDKLVYGNEEEQALVIKQRGRPDYTVFFDGQFGGQELLVLSDLLRAAHQKWVKS